MSEYVVHLYAEHDGVRCEPIVRCRDCEYGKAIEDIGCIAFHHADERLQPRDPNGFCAWGVRKGDA